MPHPSPDEEAKARLPRPDGPACMLACILAAIAAPEVRALKDSLAGAAPGIVAGAGVPGAA